MVELVECFCGHVTVLHVVLLSGQLPWGRSCIEHYRSVKRQCVFSHDELLFLIASTPTKVDIKLAECLADDLAVVIEQEKHLRSDLLAQVNRLLCTIYLFI